SRHVPARGVMTSLRLSFLLVYVHITRALSIFRCAIGSLAIVAMLSGADAGAQEIASAAPLLTMQEAIQLGIANNRALQVAALEVEKSKWEIAESKTKRLPSFSGSILGSELLTELSFTFKEGAFGNFTSTGPIPNKDSKITTPRQPTAL